MAMGDNPYEAPKSPLRAPVGVKEERSQDVRDVAFYQKGIILCMLVYLAVIFVMASLDAFRPPIPRAWRFYVAAVGLLNLLAGVVFVFLLSMKVYHPVSGFFLALLAIVPCLGLVSLLLVNSKATATLRANGYSVGFLGADLGSIPR